MTFTIRILGLDPGLSAMGWGVIAVEGSRLSHVAHGVINTRPAAGLGVRLMQLHAALSDVIAAHGPQAISVEQAFVARDPQAALKIGHARAVALLAAAQAGLEIAEYAPNHIKKCVVGAACGVTQADAADALAAAIAHAHSAPSRARVVVG